MNAKGTRFSQVTAAVACIMVDLERIRVKLELEKQPTTQEWKRLEKSIEDFKGIVKNYKKRPIKD